MNIIIETIDIVGLYGPAILFFPSLILLYSTKPYFYVYITMSLINLFLNNGLKLWVREPRPQNPISYYDDNQITGAQYYGMPSGHAQSVLFSTVFVFLTTRSPHLLIWYVFISSLSIYQRWKYRRHTANQLIIGSIIGMTVAYVSFTMTKYYLETYKTLLLENNL